MDDFFRMTKTPNMYKFSFVRHPLSRLVSAYQDKVVAKQGTVGEPVRDKYGPLPTFDQFVEYVLDESERTCRFGYLLLKLAHYKILYPHQFQQQFPFKIHLLKQ